ncbi:hypothetical protein [Bacillus sp. Marseille-Q3570]|uniref:hypothetical protein n=1 Tax=Bacillus sp. Marseille-Q3570 TaxID=2963522 RepID=UPI0021B7CBD4|nr:hypothetical protein [Bacillus sp. Marseille-Q3570]
MKFLLVIATIMFNTGLSWLFSRLVGWSFMESMFLCGLLVFIVVWMGMLNGKMSNNQVNASIKGTTGVNAGEIKPFSLSFNPFIIGTLIYLVTSGIITVVYYLPYFTT